MKWPKDSELETSSGLVFHWHKIWGISCMAKPELRFKRSRLQSSIQKPTPGRASGRVWNLKLHSNSHHASTKLTFTDRRFSCVETRLPAVLYIGRPATHITTMTNIIRKPEAWWRRATMHYGLPSPSRLVKRQSWEGRHEADEGD